MASPHRVLLSTGTTLRRGLNRTVVIAAAAALAVSLLPAIASADPRVTAAQAQQQLQALADRAEILAEQFNAARDQLDAAQRQLAADKTAIAAAQLRVDAMKTQVAQVAASAYESGGFDATRGLLSSGQPQIALQRADMLAMLADQQGATLRKATVARNKLAQAQAVAGQQANRISALQVSLAAQQKTLDAMVNQQETLLRASQVQIAADGAKAAAKAAQARASRAHARAALSKAARPAASPAQFAASVGADGRAAAALRYAYAQLGKPYRYGASGPSTFDCSGLTMRAWQAAGVALPHNALAQFRSTQHVARSQLQPGDLVYFGHPIHHEGIYIGGGKMIEAPYTGARVRITDFGYRHDYAGASRP